jgi:hypothetical protein
MAWSGSARLLYGSLRRVARLATGGAKPAGVVDWRQENGRPPMARHMLGLAVVLAGWSGIALAEGGWDKPRREQTVRFAAPSGHRDDDVTVHCLTFPRMMVREVHEGTDMGMRSVSVIPAAEIGPKSCAAGLEPGPAQLPDDSGSGFGGALGEFVMLSQPDGFSGTTGFSVFDGASRTKLFTDRHAQKASSAIQVTLRDGGATLAMRYARGVVAECSLVTDGAACWAKMLAAGAPPGLTATMAPLAACTKAYAAARMKGDDLRDPSVVAYRIQVTLPRLGTIGQLAQGPVTCWPAE